LFHAEGTYYQFSAGSAPGDAPAHRAISTSIFHCGDSITAWSSLILGGSSPNLRFDPVVVTALLRPYALPKPRNQYHFPGLLLALADSTSVPTAMRIILRQDTRSPQLSGVNADNPAAFVEDAQELALYETAVSNVLPGHVLALGHSARDMSNNLNLSWLAMQS
jgi:hypothetical protein